MSDPIEDVIRALKSLRASGSRRAMTRAFSDLQEAESWLAQVERGGR